MLPQRRSIRRPGYDYSRPGYYFITICAYRNAHIFGEITKGVVRLSDLGFCVERSWRAIPQHAPFTRLDAFVVMPNHLHGIVEITADQYHPPAAWQLAPCRSQPGSIGSIVRAFKGAVTRWALGNTDFPRIWHRNYHERIVRDQRAHDAIRRYIEQNPAEWRG